MSDRKEIPLGNGWHTLFSDEVWFLVVVSNSDEVVLEGRFQSDAPDRTGYPTWAATEFCISKTDEEAVCRVFYAGAAEMLAATRLSFVPEVIWSRAIQECQKLVAASE